MERFLLADFLGGLSCLFAAGALTMHARNVWRHMGRIERLCVLSLMGLFIAIGLRMIFDLVVLDAICGLLVLPLLIVFLWTLRGVSNQRRELLAELAALRLYMETHPTQGASAIGEEKALRATTERILRAVKSG